MSRSRFFISAAAMLMFPAFVQAQTVGPATSAPVDQSMPAPAEQAMPAAPVEQAVPAADPALAATAAAPADAAVAVSAADGVTKEGNQYVKDGRKATKLEVAEYKKVEKAKRE